MSAGAARFGTEVRAHREGREWSQRHLASLLHYQQPHIHRVETGEQFPTPMFAEMCDEAFGTFGTFARLRAEIAEQGSRYTYAANKDNIPGQHPYFFRDYVKLEQHAVRISDYSPMLVMGLLQTPEYAEAVFRLGNPRENADEARARVKIRMQRTEVLERDPAPLLWMIIHENALRTVLGDARIMADQMKRLLEADEAPNIVVQVLTRSSSAPVLPGGFTILQQPDRTQVVHVEGPLRGHLEADDESVDLSIEMYDRLRSAALPEPESRALIHSVLKEYEDESPS